LQIACSISHFITLFSYFHPLLTFRLVPSCARTPIKKKEMNLPDIQWSKVVPLLFSSCSLLCWSYDEWVTLFSSSQQPRVPCPHSFTPQTKMSKKKVRDFYFSWPIVGPKSVW
jgi:hypothetical protein